jgi:hypothetical protein
LEDDELNMHGLTKALLLTLAMVAAPAALAQGPNPAPAGVPAATPTARQGLDVLKGTWVRPDGGYVISVKGVGADGQLEATYFNPNQLPFAKAQASTVGGTLRVALVLQAGGYAGSTYDLVYDPATDRLRGTYYQAVARQKFDVYFARR